MNMKPQPREILKLILIKVFGVPTHLWKNVVIDVLDIIEYYDGDEYESLCEESVESTLSIREEYKEYEIDWKKVHGFLDGVKVGIGGIKQFEQNFPI